MDGYTRIYAAANESTQRSDHLIILIYEAKTQDAILSWAKRG